MQPNKTLSVNGEPFEVLRLLGKGKGGYSFLVRSQSHSKTEYVLKQMHHEPMPFLQPNDKVQAEIRDYRRLCELGIRLPAMLAIDIAKERIFDTTRSISEVAYSLGFRYPQHFPRLFKKVVGCSPHAYRTAN